MGPWKEVYFRDDESNKDIVRELKGIQDQDARFSVPLLLEAGQDPDAIQKTLSAAFDDPAVTELKVFNIGDGEAVSGLILAARRQESDEGTVVVLMD